MLSKIKWAQFMPQKPDSSVFDDRFSLCSLWDAVMSTSMPYVRPTSETFIEAKFLVTSQKLMVSVLLVTGRISLTSLPVSPVFL